MTEQQNTVIKRQFLPRQWEFLNSGKKELLYSGAFGAGKSYTLCAAAFAKAAIKGNRVGLGRKTLKALKQSTRVTLLEGDGKTPPVLPPGTYKYHKTDNTITIHNGGKIVLFGIDEPETLGSWPFGSIYIDECVELDEADWIMLLGRCRNTVDPVRQLGGACNPAHPNHWLAKRFGISGKAVANTELIQTCSADNDHLPEDYLGQLQTLTGTDFERYVLGKWVGYEGLVYSEWAPEVHVQRFPEDFQFEQVVAGVDEGYTHPAVRLSIGLHRVGGELALHVFDEFYQTGVQPTTFLDMCAGRTAREKSSLHLVDPSAAGLIADLNAKGIPSIAGDNAILDGIRATKTFLRIREDKKARLTVDPRCEATIGEMTAYAWKPEKDAPVDKDNHALDALRYVCTHYGGQFVAPTISYAGMEDRPQQEHSEDTLRLDEVYRQDETLPQPRHEQLVESVTADGDFGWDGI